MTRAGDRRHRTPPAVPAAAQLGEPSAREGGRVAIAQRRRLCVCLLEVDAAGTTRSRLRAARLPAAAAAAVEGGEAAARVCTAMPVVGRAPCRDTRACIPLKAPAEARPCLGGTAPACRLLTAASCKASGSTTESVRHEHGQPVSATQALRIRTLNCLNSAKRQCDASIRVLKVQVAEYT